MAGQCGAGVPERPVVESYPAGAPRSVPFTRYGALPATLAPAVSPRPTVLVPANGKVGPLRWAYGVTTCPARVKDGLLSRTLTSLAGAGFDRPRVFADGEVYPMPAEEHDPQLGVLEVVERRGRVKPFANWVLAFAELYYRDPCADRFALFQDDLVCVRGLRAYLDAAPWPGPPAGYVSLYAAPVNEAVAPPGAVGWHESRVLSEHPHAAHRGLQVGHGALALVFDRAGAEALLASRHLTARLVVEPGDGNRLADRVVSPTGWRSIDGAVVTAMNYAGFREYVHAPGLVQHTGVRSTIDKEAGSTGDRERFPAYDWTPDRVSRTFPGEGWDARTLLTGASKS